MLSLRVTPFGSQVVEAARRTRAVEWNCGCLVDEVDNVIVDGCDSRHPVTPSEQLHPFMRLHLTGRPWNRDLVPA